jgi:transposase
MKTVSKIDPEKEYENAKKIIELASKQQLDNNSASSLETSVDNLITAARVLMEREERRRGAPKEDVTHLPKGRQKGAVREDSKKLPSERYPDLEIKEDILEPDTAPSCPCCQKPMRKSGLFDVSEKLQVIPKKYFIQRIKRVKFNCGNCHGSMLNTPPLPSIVPTSNYGDSLIIDVALSKYCDIIPIERYSQIASRSGMGYELPSQSLIGLTHHLANFLTGVSDKIKYEVSSSAILQADETRHKMLEGDETANWQLWGFFSPTACYFETHNTRSGDVPLAFLKESQTKVLVTDGFAGYGKAIRDLNNLTGRVIAEGFCNAHAYRYFKDASITWKEESAIFLQLYGEIYELERLRKDLANQISLAEQLEFRKRMLPLFKQIKQHCEDQRQTAMVKSGILEAMNYFLNHYDGLILCITDIAIPLDNNLAERELRAPVIGRKTWYGNHSKRGAQTSAALFSIVQSCHLNNVNPRDYFPWIVNLIHRNEEVKTPAEYACLQRSKLSSR